MEEAVERFIAAAVCVGYCHDSGRSDLADRIQDDLWKHFHDMGMDEKERLDQLLELVRACSTPWAKYCAACILARSDTSVAQSILLPLLQVPHGVVSVLAQQALFVLQATRH